MLLNGGEWSVSYPHHFPRNRAVWYSLNSRLVRLQSQPGCSDGRGKIPATVVQPVAWTLYWLNCPSSHLKFVRKVELLYMMHL